MTETQNQNQPPLDEADYDADPPAWLAALIVLFIVGAFVLMILLVRTEGLHHG